MDSTYTLHIDKNIMIVCRRDFLIVIYCEFRDNL